MLQNLLLGNLSLATALMWIFHILLAISVHEWAHATTAFKLKDPTAKQLGRLTLNPLAHLDPLGTLLILIAGFGWGKPVPFNPLNLEDPQKDGAIISLSGPASNLLLAGVLGLLLRLFPPFIPLLLPGITLNLSLAIFNLLPIHPLDGFKIALGVLPPSLTSLWLTTAPYGIWLIMILFIWPSDPLSYLIRATTTTFLQILGVGF